MSKKDKPEIRVEKRNGSILLDIPRLFAVDGTMHAIAVAVAVVILGAIVQTEATLGKVLPPPLNAHPNSLLWGILGGGYALFVLVSLAGFGIGTRGRFVSMATYSVHIEVSPALIVIENRWLMRKKVVQVPTQEVTSISQNGCGLTITTSSGGRVDCFFDLYPPTVKSIKGALEKAKAEV